MRHKMNDMVDKPKS